MSAGTRSPNYKPTGAPPPGKYLHDFSKALASEVRILLDEVGKLREERRALQIEIAELMATKSKHSNGGDYIPDWQRRFMPEAIEEPPPPPPPEEPAGPAKAGWRVVHKPREPKAKKTPAALPAPPPVPAPEPPKASAPSWAQWKPNPHVAPPIHTVGPVEPSIPGLFGPEK